MGAPNTLYRAPIGRGSCGWCGQIRRLYAYGGDPRPERYSGGYCNLSCFMAYADIRRRDFDYVQPVSRGGAR